MSTNTPTPPAQACCAGDVSCVTSVAAAELSGRLAAIADPTRLQVLSIIANTPSGEVCACDFVEPLGKSQPTISHHLKVLTEAGFIKGHKRGRWIWYRLQPGSIGSVAASLSNAMNGAD